MLAEIGALMQNTVGVYAWPDDDLSEDVQFLGEISQNTWNGISQAFGDAEPLYAPDNTQRGASKLVDFSEGADEPWESEFVERLHPEGKNFIYRMKEKRCRVNFFFAFSPCGDPGDPELWNFGILAEYARLNEMEISEFQTFESTTGEVTVTGTISGMQQNRILPLSLSKIGGALVTTEVVDTVFADAVNCGNCGPASNGCERMFAVIENDGATAEPELLFRFKKSDGTYHEGNLSLTALGTTNQPSALAVMGRYLVILSEAGLSHLYVKHGAFTPTVTPTPTQITGYTTAKGPRAIWVKNARKALVVGAGGHIYELKNPTSAPVLLDAGTYTAQNLNAIHGAGSYILIGGASNTLLFSENDALSFSAVTAPAGQAGVAITAVYVRSRYTWEIGYADGKYFYTIDGGQSFAQRTLPNQGAITGIKSIRYSHSSDEVGVLTVNTASAGYALLTFTGGRRWSDGESRVKQLSTLPTVVNAAVLCGFNRLLLAGVGVAPAGIWGYAVNN